MTRSILNLVLISYATFLFISFFVFTPVFAQVTSCADMQGGSVFTKTGLNRGIVTGKNCSASSPGDYSYTCIGSPACAHKVYYCTALNDKITYTDSFGKSQTIMYGGCESTYPQDGCDKAPDCYKADTGPQSKIGEIFGQISPPPALQKFGFGSVGINKFLSSGVILIYSIATIVLIFMILWGAFEWLTSGGDKEKLASAQRRILHAIIGIILFAVAFAVIRVLGVFTGFRFFSE